MKNLFTALFNMVLIPGIILANIIHVPTDQPTIQNGINAAVNGDTVLVADSTYYENINFKGKAIIVASHFLIDGNTAHIDSTIIDGSQPSHPDSGSVVYFQSGEDTTSILCGFTITGGTGTYVLAFNVYVGGGIIMFTGGKVRYNKITGNHVQSSGLQQSTVGGGLAFRSFNKTSLIIEYNEFTYNSLTAHINTDGGGIWLGPLWDDGFIRISNNLISNNSVTCTGSYKALGGGIGVNLPIPTAGNILIENNIISNNELHCIASIGGGIYVVYTDPGYVINDQNPSPLIRNNIISNNDSEGLGGGIGVWTIEYGNHYPNSNIKPQPVLINNTIANNVAQDGCGLFNFDSYPLLLNNILWDDLSAFDSNEIFDRNINFSPYVPPYHDPYNDGEVFVRYSDIQDTIWPGEGNIDTDPLFVLGDILYNLSYSSLCIGAGTDSVDISGTWYYAPPFDYDGNDRPNSIDEFVDMGAIESKFPRFPSGITEYFNDYPTNFRLSQNHPNPFNPSTKIKFDLPKPETVKIEVYNIIGQKIETLLNQPISAGYHEVEFNGQNLSSGIYLYRIEAGEWSDVKKMILLR